MKLAIHIWYQVFLLMLVSSCRSGNNDVVQAFLLEKANSGQRVTDSADSITITTLEEGVLNGKASIVKINQYEVVVAGEGNTFAGIYPSCLAIKQALPDAPDGNYPLRISLEDGQFRDYLATCDMSTDGGGWTLILNYVHRGGQDPQLEIRNDSFPLLSTNNLGDSEAQTIFWGHLTNQMARLIGGGELRFYCRTNEHNRILHFKTSSTGCLQHVFSGQGSCRNVANDFSVLEEHSSFLPAFQDSAGRNQNDFALTEGTIEGRMGSVRFWNIGARFGVSSWDCDNFTGSAAYHTIHRVWLR